MSPGRITGRLRASFDVAGAVRGVDPGSFPQTRTAPLDVLSTHAGARVAPDAGSDAEAMRERATR